MFNHTALKRSLAIGVALGASPFPAAAAARAIQPGDLATPPPAPPTVHRLVSSAPTGSDHPNSAGPSAAQDFRWDDAGIGAAATIVLLGAGGAAAGGLRRRQTQRAAVS